MKLLIAILLASIVSISFAAEPVATKPKQQKVLATENGRYAIGQISDFRGDQYMLDTQTGRLWQIVVGKENRTKLQAVPFIQLILGNEAYIPDTLDDVVLQNKYSRERAVREFSKVLEAEGEKKE